LAQQRRIQVPLDERSEELFNIIEKVYPFSRASVASFALLRGLEQLAGVPTLLPAMLAESQKP